MRRIIPFILILTGCVSLARHRKELKQAEDEQVRRCNIKTGTMLETIRRLNVSCYNQSHNR